MGTPGRTRYTYVPCVGVEPLTTQGTSNVILIRRPCLLRVAATAAAEAEALEHTVTGALRVDTDGLTVEETADLIAARTRSARG